jgi:hypothetical protein
VLLSAIVMLCSVLHSLSCNTVIVALVVIHTWERPRSPEQILIIFGTAHRIVVLKLLPEFQAPAATFWWVKRLPQTDRQTDTNYVQFLFIAVLSTAAVNGFLADAGVLFYKTVMLGTAIKERPCRCRMYVQ